MVRMGMDIEFPGPPPFYVRAVDQGYKFVFETAPENDFIVPTEDVKNNATRFNLNAVQRRALDDFHDFGKSKSHW
jgi:hypothetical protein